MPARILELRKAENVIVIPGPIYAGLNQEGILERFTCYYPPEPPSLTAIYFRATANPIVLPIHIILLRDLIAQEVQIAPDKMIWNGQHCLQTAQLTPENLLPRQTDREVLIEDLIHTVAHIVLPYAQRCREPWISLEDLGDFEFQELSFPNQNAPNEGITVFNFPSKIEDVSKLLGIILDHLDHWLIGEVTTDLQEQLRAYDALAESHRRRS